MRKISDRLRKRIVAQLGEMLAETEHEYPGFLKEAKRLLSAEAEEPRFEFITRRLWLEDGGEPRHSWRASLAERYVSFDGAFEWEHPDIPRWAARPLVEATLSTLQRWYPYRVGLTAAVEVLGSIDGIWEDAEVIA